MKINYKGCTIEANRETSLGGDEMLYYSIFTEDGFEVASSFTSDVSPVEEFIEDLKSVVDDYIENPSDYEDDIPEATVPLVDVWDEGCCVWKG